MAGIKDFLLEQGPKLALMFMAAKQGGPQAAAGLQQGLNAALVRKQQQARQQQLDTQAQEDRAFTRSNVEADNARLDEQMQMRKFQEVMALIERASQQQAETASDPDQAQAALQQQAGAAAGAYGVPAEQVTPLIPSIAPMISQRKKKQAQILYERAEKRYNPKGEHPEWETAITLQTGELFGDITPADLRALFDVRAVNAAGALAVPPALSKPTQILDLGGKKVVVDPTQLQPGMEFQETPNPTSGGADTEPLVAVIGPDGQPVLVPRRQAVGKKPASSREQGRPVQSADANRIIDLDTSMNDLHILKGELTGAGATGAVSKVGAMLPNVVTEYTGWGSGAKQRQAVINRVKQVIGKALEGGVLRKEDEYKYILILPTIGDPPEVVEKKIVGLERAIQQRRDTTLEGLGDAGFDTSKFQNTAPGSADPTSDPLGLFK